MTYSEGDRSPNTIKVFVVVIITKKTKKSNYNLLFFYGYGHRLFVMIRMEEIV